jgi:hypothetical protein
MCRNPSLGLRPRQGGCEVAGLEVDPGVTSQGCGSQEERNLGVKRKEAREQRQTHWKGAGQEEEARESSHTPVSLRKCEGV